MSRQKGHAEENLLRPSQRESWQPPEPPSDFADRVLLALNDPEAYTSRARKQTPPPPKMQRKNNNFLLASAGGLLAAASFALGVFASPHLLAPTPTKEDAAPLVTAVRPDTPLEPTTDKGEPEMLFKGTATLALGSVLAAVSPFLLEGGKAAPSPYTPGNAQQICGEMLTSCQEVDGQELVLCRKVLVLCEEAGVVLPPDEICYEEGPHTHKHKDKHKEKHKGKNKDWKELEELAEDIEEMAEELEKLEEKMLFQVKEKDGKVIVRAADPDLQKARKKLEKKIKEHREKLQKAQERLEKAAPLPPSVPAPPAPPGFTLSLDEVAPGLIIEIEGLEGIPGVVLEEILEEIEAELEEAHEKSEELTKKKLKKLRKKLEKKQKKDRDDDDDDDD